MSQQRDRPCYLCGRVPGTTKDHIFPRLLFPKGGSYPKLPPRLPACQQCNNALSQDEELFQQLALSWRALDTPEARKVWDTKVRPNLRGKRPCLRPRVLKYTELVPFVNQAGQQIGRWPVLKVPPEIVERVLAKMVKGLYYLETHTPLPINTEISVSFAQQNPSGIKKIDLPEIRSRAKRCVVGSEDILVYWRATAADQPLASITWFVFYRWNAFCVITLPPTAAEGAGAPVAPPPN